MMNDDSWPVKEKLYPVDQQLETDEVTKPGGLAIIGPDQHRDVGEAFR